MVYAEFVENGLKLSSMGSVVVQNSLRSSTASGMIRWVPASIGSSARNSVLVVLRSGITTSQALSADLRMVQLRSSGIVNF